MKAAERAAWIKLISEGHDPKLAAIALGLPVSVADEPKFQKAVQAALAMATAKLREKVLALAIGNSDIRALEKEIERRELTADSGGVQRIVRVVIFKCEKCGYEPDVNASGGQSRPLHTKRGTETPTNGAGQ